MELSKEYRVLALNTGLDTLCALGLGKIGHAEGISFHMVCLVVGVAGHAMCTGAWKG